MSGNKGRTALEYFVILAIVIGCMFFGLNAIGYKSITAPQGTHNVR